MATMALGSKEEAFQLEGQTWYINHFTQSLYISFH